jgi:uncharacterized membrane protein YkoI
MLRTARKTAVTLAALAALALGGSALAGAAQNSSSSSATTTTQSSQAGQPPGGGRPAGQHVGANGKTEQLLTGDTAAKVKAAALKKVSGTVERVETDVDHGSPYEAHVTKSDGTQVEVLVNKDFEVTAVNEMGHP